LVANVVRQFQTEVSEEMVLALVALAVFQWVFNLRLLD